MNRLCVGGIIMVVIIFVVEINGLQNMAIVLHTKTRNYCAQKRWERVERVSL